MYLRSASPTQAWQARRGFSGLAGKGTYRRRRRLHGLGDDSLFDIPTDLPLDTSSIDTTSFESLPDPFQTLPSGAFGMPQPLAPTATNYPTITPPVINPTSTGSQFTLSTLAVPAGQPAAPASPLNSILQAFGIGANAAKAVTGSATRPAAPAGYAYNSAGQLVPVGTASLASSGGTLLLLGGGVFLLAMMAGGRK
jgi:hypothetical protein